MVDAPGLYSFVGVKKLGAGLDPPKVKPGIPVGNGAIFTKDPTHMPFSWQQYVREKAGFL